MIAVPQLGLFTEVSRQQTLLCELDSLVELCHVSLDLARQCYPVCLDFVLEVLDPLFMNLVHRDPSWSEVGWYAGWWLSHDLDDLAMLQRCDEEE
jgi:hypothetical protein